MLPYIVVVIIIIRKKDGMRDLYQINYQDIQVKEMHIVKV